MVQDSRGKTAKNVELWWHPYLHHMRADYIKLCNICQQYNSKKRYNPQIGRFPTPNGPGKK